MKKSNILLITLLLMLGLCFAAAAETGSTVYTSEEYQYILLENGAAQIINARNETELIVPDRLDGHPVISIGDHAFFHCNQLTSITLPEDLTSIGNSAFSGCMKLTSIFLPKSLTRIGNENFSQCPDNAVFTVERDSWAAQWCKENGKNYTYTDSLDWLNE